MTDNDDPDPPRKPTALDGPAKRPSGRPAGADDARTNHSRQGGAIGAHVAPTDPEVPSAKRRGALRRQRSLVGLSAVIMSLLSITLVLLYRASLRVGTRDNEDGLPLIDDGPAASPVDVIHEGTFIRLAPSPTQSEAEIGDDAPASNDNVPASSASSFPKPPPALDIIRTPAF